MNHIFNFFVLYKLIKCLYCCSILKNENVTSFNLLSNSKMQRKTIKYIGYLFGIASLIRLNLPFEMNNIFLGFPMLIFAYYCVKASSKLHLTNNTIIHFDQKIKWDELKRYDKDIRNDVIIFYGLDKKIRVGTKYMIKDDLKIIEKKVKEKEITIVKY